MDTFVESDPQPAQAESAPVTQKPGEVEPTPTPFNELVDQFRSLVGFWATRRAVIHGEPLYDYTGPELRARHLMGPWTFNATQSLIATVAAGFIGKAIGLFYPSEAAIPNLPPGSDRFFILLATAEPIRAEIFDWLSTGLAPFTLLVVANMVGWASWYKSDLTRERRIRSANAYLYFDGAYGFIPQVLLALFVSMLVLSGTLPLAISIGIWTVVFVATIWQIRLTNIVLASKLFEVNGYSPKRRTLFNIRTRVDNRGPWELYRTVAISAVGAFFWILLGVTLAVSYAVALSVAWVKLAVA